MKRLAVVLAACALSAIGLQAQGAPTPAAVKADKPAAIRAAAPESACTSGARQDEAVRVLLVADRETTLSSTVAAKIKKIDPSIGTEFKTGQPLVIFECDEAMARLDMAKAELAGAVETYEAKVRMQGLGQASDVEVALAASAADKAKAQLALQQAQVAQCTVTAPWAGRVAKVHVRTHMSVTPGQPLLDLVKSGPLRLKLNLPSRWFRQIKPGALFDVCIDETGKHYQARVAHINSRVDAVSQTIEVEAVMVRSYPELLPGMSGTVNLPMTH